MPETGVNDQGHEACLEGFWAGRVDCRICDVARRMPFNAVGPDHLGRDLREVGNYPLPPYTPITQAGSPATAVFSIRAGFIKLWRHDESGRCRIVRLLRPGDMLGLEAVLQPAYAMSADTLNFVKLCRIPLETLTRLQEREPALYREVERRWHSQLRRTEHLMVSVATGPSRERVLKLLRYLAEFAAPDPCPRLRRLDMAAMLDVSSETAARVIADLKTAGLLVETPTELRFDPARLVLE
jgi:CRP/FNR family transcriptional regulator, anaerobic regulatory protein